MVKQVMEDLDSDWHEFRLSDKDISKLTEIERYILFVGGHIFNEMNAIIKISLAIHEQGYSDKFSQSHWNTLSMFITLAGAGKIREAWKCISQITEEKEFNRRIRPYMNAEGIDALEELKNYFLDFKNTSLYKTRNSVGFHYPDKTDFSRSFSTDGMDEESSMLFYFADADINHLFYSSSMFKYVFAAGEIDQEDILGSIEKIVEDQTKYSQMISKMILAMIVSILRAKFRERFDDCFSRGRKILLKTNSVNALIPVADVQFYKKRIVQ